MMRAPAAIAAAPPSIRRGVAMNWYLEVLKKYFVFDGRARRTEYWMFGLINLIVVVVLTFLDHMLGTVRGDSRIGLLAGIYTLVVLLPSLGVTVRRLHDTDRSGWWILISFVPLIGGIVLLVFMVLDSTPGPNRFGPNPKGA
jgi:uncharacterized membrane protein YhaH (DUF805 family)